MLILLRLVIAWAIAEPTLTIAVSVDDDCHHDIKNTTYGMILLPGQNSDGKDVRQCSWRIEQSLGEQIVITFRQTNLAEGAYFSIQDGESSSITMVTYNNAFPPPKVYFSRSNILIIVYYSGIQKEVERWAHRDAMRRTVGDSFVFNFIFERYFCGGWVNGDNGYIHVPYYVFSSPKTERCSWRIVGPEKKSLRITKEIFSLPRGSCAYASMIAQETHNGEPIAFLCEEFQPSRYVFSKSNDVTVSLTTFPNDLVKMFRYKLPVVTLKFESIDPCDMVVFEFDQGIRVEKRSSEVVASSRFCSFQVLNRAGLKTVADITFCDLSQRELLSFLDNNAKTIALVDGSRHGLTRVSFNSSAMITLETVLSSFPNRPQCRIAIRHSLPPSKVEISKSSQLQEENVLDFNAEPRSDQYNENCWFCFSKRHKHRYLDIYRERWTLMTLTATGFLISVLILTIAVCALTFSPARQTEQRRSQSTTQDSSDTSQTVVVFSKEGVDVKTPQVSPKENADAEQRML